MTPEGKVKVKIKRWYEQNLPGHWRVSPRGGPFGKAGTGDDVICYLGFFVMIEVKSDDGQLTGLQTNCLNAVAKAGGVAAVVKGFDVERLFVIKSMVDEKHAAMVRGLDAVQN